MAKSRPVRAKHGGVYVKSRRGEEALTWHFVGHRGTFGRRHVGVWMWFHFWGRTSDGDNCEKAVLDAIQRAGVIENDDQVREGHWKIVRAPHRDAQHTYVEIRALAE